MLKGFLKPSTKGEPLALAGVTYKFLNFLALLAVLLTQKLIEEREGQGRGRDNLIFVLMSMAK